MSHSLSLSLAIPFLGLLACTSTSSDDALSDAATLPDQSVAQDLGTAPDLQMAPDLLPARCELPYDVRAIDKIATGAVTITPAPSDPASYNAEVDAVAGGSMKASENPFVYIDLINRKKVEITDVQADNSKDWDIAFKRWQIKINSGDSGPGGVTVSRVAGKTLSEVTSAPTDMYKADSYFDEKCKFSFDPIGGIGTELSDWYEYESGTSRLVPKKEVWVLKRRDGKGHIKVQLSSYYKGTTSANYSLSWSYLP
ncbi:MAG: HmuY family protein [Myxococcales bacterium]|nr:HmuY family protein [Myxococcales bacterium]